MITQSFKVSIFGSDEVHIFIILGEDNWIRTCKLGTEPWNQQEVQKAYDYFTSHWQDYDVMLF
jgi:hypothetical protein